MTTPATYAPITRGMASFDWHLQLGRSEPLPAGLKRVTLEQLEHGARGFFEPETSFGEAVHESRKSIKRVRALLRLVRGELPERIFEFENRTLRETARSMAAVRAAAAVLEAAELIVDLYGDLLAEGTFKEMMQRLTRRRDLIEMSVLEERSLVDRVVRSLERAHARYSSWPAEPEAREVYGMGIRDSYEALHAGLETTYRRGRHGMVTAYRSESSEDFHAWRRRVKDLRHQMEFLAPLWPEVVVGMAMTLDRLGTLLGEDHDLAELTTLIRSRPDLCPDQRERSLFFALVRQRRSELRVASEILGRRVYAEKPVSLAGRFGEYWDSRQIAISDGLDTIVVY